MKRPLLGTGTPTLLSTLVVLCLTGVPSAHAGGSSTPPLAAGKKLTIEFCQACHFFEGTDQAGTVGPPFVAMKQRFPDPNKLEGIIHDPHAAIKPNSMMPPFGRNGLLNRDDINKIIDFLYTL